MDKKTMEQVRKVFDSKHGDGRVKRGNADINAFVSDGTWVIQFMKEFYIRYDSIECYDYAIDMVRFALKPICSKATCIAILTQIYLCEFDRDEKASIEMHMAKCPKYLDYGKKLYEGKSVFKSINGDEVLIG